MNVSSTVSALQANSIEFAVSAHNVANVATPEFQPQTVDRSTSPSGGVEVTVRRDEEGSVEIVDEMIRQKRLQFSNKAQLKTFVARDEMVGTLLDIIA